MGRGSVHSAGFEKNWQLEQFHDLFCQSSDKKTLRRPRLKKTITFSQSVLLLPWRRERRFHGSRAVERAQPLSATGRPSLTAAAAGTRTDRRRTHKTPHPFCTCRTFICTCICTTTASTKRRTPARKVTSLQSEAQRFGLVVRATPSSQAIISKFGLREGKDEQSYGLGLKEVWRVPKEKCNPG